MPRVGQFHGDGPPRPPRNRDGGYHGPSDRTPVRLDESTWILPDGLRVPYACACGASYEVWSTKWPYPDRGKLTCEACGAVIIEWEARRCWTAKLVKRSGAAGRPPV